MLRGRFHWNQRRRRASRKRRNCSQEATSRAPQYAPAYAGLADVYLSQYDYGLAVVGGVDGAGACGGHQGA